MQDLNISENTHIQNLPVQLARCVDGSSKSVPDETSQRYNDLHGGNVRLTETAEKTELSL